MKKFINQIENVELEMLEGIAKAHPDHLKKLPDFNVLVRAEKKEGKVALISGGGSGHEPAHGGYVGKGMLDAAVAGAVFTSPTPDQVEGAIRADKVALYCDNCQAGRRSKINVVDGKKVRVCCKCGKEI